MDRWLRHVFTILVAGPLALQAAAAEPHDSPTLEINQQVADVWRQYDIKPSARAYEYEWCRRVFLDLIGRIPTVDELEAFQRDRPDQRHARLVDRLLHDDSYVEDYARYWTTIWTNLLLGRTGGGGDRDLAHRSGLQTYLRDSFAHNKSYRDLVHELISAEGTTVPGSERFNGATNFLANKLDEKAVQATAKTAQLFLGTQVQCTQCHNHPFNDWKQNQFWELNAFFRQTTALRRFRAETREIRFVELTNEDFAGEGSDPRQAEIYYEERNGILKAAFPVFIDGQPLPERSGYLSDVNRRLALADFVVAADEFSLAIVNRLWAHFLGYGFTRPIDDFGPHNPPTHPELLQSLSTSFRESEYDLRQLMRWIVLSQPYGLSSRANKSNVSDDPQLGEFPKFSRFYLRQMRAEELYESLLTATEAHRTRGNEEAQEAAKARWLRQFNIAFGTDEGGDTTTFNGSITQSLMMFNGDLMRQATSPAKEGLLYELSSNKLPFLSKVERLYLAALCRRPRTAENKLAQQLLAARAEAARPWREDKQADATDPTLAALQDIWWALLNCNEFIINH